MENSFEAPQFFKNGPALLEKVQLLMATGLARSFGYLGKVGDNRLELLTSALSRQRSKPTELITPWGR